MPAPWCAEAARALDDAARGDLGWIEREVRAGISQLYRITGECSGWVVTRQEGDEFVIVAGAGENARPVMAWITDRALAAGLSVRTHIQRPGLRRMYEAIGFKADEIVMRIRPHG